MIKRTGRISLLIAILMWIMLSVVAITLGTVKIPILEVVRIIFSRLPVLKGIVSPVQNESHELIVLSIRLPRIIMAGFTGAGLSIVGVAFQALFRNPMADPYVLGTSSGAAAGAAIAIVAGVGTSFMGFGGVTIAAFIAATATMYLVYNIARTGGRIPVKTLLLAGITVSFFMSSLISLIMVFNRESIHSIVFWMMGSLNALNWKQVLIIVPLVLLGTILLSAFYRDFNLLLTGDETALSLGLNTEKFKKFILILSSFIVAACVSFTGVIGFVGLLVPHIVRMSTGSNHKLLIPLSAVGGAIFLLVADTLARTITGNELPVGAITSLFGAPYFMALLLKNKKGVRL